MLNLKKNKIIWNKLKIPNIIVGNNKDERKLSNDIRSLFLIINNEKGKKINPKLIIKSW